MAQKRLKGGGNGKRRGRPPKSAKPIGDDPRASKRWPVENVSRRSVADLVPYVQNPKLHPPAQVDLIAKSMATYGQAQVILIDEAGEIIAGHGRVLAAKQLGWSEIVVGEARGWSETEKRAYRILDNQLAHRAPWDDALLSAELGQLMALEFDLSSLGFDPDQLAAFGLGVGEMELPVLPDGDRPAFRQITFTVHETQVTPIEQALAKAKHEGPFDTPNENSNGNALARVCEAYVG